MKAWKGHEGSGKRKLIIPSNLDMESAAPGGVIPPNAIFSFLKWNPRASDPPLFLRHETHSADRTASGDGAKLADSAGWEMPILYASGDRRVPSCSVRRRAPSMSRIWVHYRLLGQRSLVFLQRMTTNNVSTLTPGQAHYLMVCNENGGIKVDTGAYRHEGHRVFVVRQRVQPREDPGPAVGASNVGRPVPYRRSPRRARPDRDPRPGVYATSSPAGAEEIAELKMPAHRCDIQVDSRSCFVARTGYCGEPGYELNVPAGPSSRYLEILAAGRRPKVGLKPGGARRPGSPTSGNGVFVIRERYQRRDDPD